MFILSLRSTDYKCFFSFFCLLSLFFTQQHSHEPMFYLSNRKQKQVPPSGTYLRTYYINNEGMIFYGIKIILDILVSEDLATLGKISDGLLRQRIRSRSNIPDSNFSGMLATIHLEFNQKTASRTIFGGGLLNRVVV